MIKKCILLSAILLFSSCASLIKNQAIQKEYRNVPLLDKKIVVLPFARNAIQFDDPRDAEAFDSLDRVVNGLMPAACTMMFSGTVAAMVNNGAVMPLDDPSIAARLMDTLQDSSGGTKVISMTRTYNSSDGSTVTRSDTVRIPDCSRIKTIIPDANVALYIRSIRHLRAGGTRKISAEFLYLDIDNEKVITRGTVNAKLGLSELSPGKNPKGEAWFKWVSDIAIKTSDKGPFVSERNVRTPLNFTYKKSRGNTISIKNSSGKPALDYMLLNHIPSKEWKVSVEVDKLMATSSAEISKVIKDSLNQIPLTPPPSNWAAAAATKEKIAEEEKMLFSACAKMSGTVILEATRDSEKMVSFRRFFCSAGSSEIPAAIYRIFNANDSVSRIEVPPAGSLRFVIPIAVSVQPETWNRQATGSIDSIYINLFHALKTINSGEVAQQVALQQAYLAELRAARQAWAMQMQQMRWMQQNQQFMRQINIPKMP